MIEISRRTALLLGGSLACTVCASFHAMAQSDEKDPDLRVDMLLNDPETPTGGNPKGDVTMVMFFDYNCPFCMKAQPDLVRLFDEDKKIRVVYKDWPIFGDVSTYAAQVALASKWQDKYVAVHDALIGKRVRKATKDQVRSIASEAGLDLPKLDGDLRDHATEIAAVLKRTDKQAVQLDLPGTPVFLIGRFKVQAALDLKGFKEVVRDARRKP